jgi:hypothetical protein
MSRAVRRFEAGLRFVFYERTACDIGKVGYAIHLCMKSFATHAQSAVVITKYLRTKRSRMSF